MPDVLFVMVAVAATSALALLVVMALDPGLDRAARSAPAPGGPTGWGWLDARLVRLRVGHAAAALALAALAVASVAEGHPGPLLFAAALLAVLFFRAWRAEFVDLMAAPDDAFPGRRDKLVWAVLMVALPPVGLSALRAYRRETERKADAEAEAEPTPEPAGASAPHGRAWGAVLRDLF